ncbi:MAG TPA: T9SS type A sorting domain-containing protein, partial [Flavipsychrobacter sp.]
VSITASPNRPLNVDEYITFTATVVNGGNFPKFQWKRNGQDVQGATGPVWSANTLNDNDSISVEVISSYRCPQPIGAKSNGIRVRVLTGVGEVNHIGKLEVYPNPNNGTFTVSGLAGATTVDVEVLNAIGQIIYVHTPTINDGSDKLRIELSDTPMGIYVLKIHVDGQMYHKLLRIE